MSAKNIVCFIPGNIRQRHRISDTFEMPAFNRGYEHNLASVWALESLDRGALAILNVMSMLDPECVHEEMLLSKIGSTQLNNFPPQKQRIARP